MHTTAPAKAAVDVTRFGDDRSPGAGVAGSIELLDDRIRVTHRGEATDLRPADVAWVRASGWMLIVKLKAGGTIRLAYVRDRSELRSAVFQYNPLATVAVLNRVGDTTLKAHLEAMVSKGFRVRKSPWMVPDIEYVEPGGVVGPVLMALTLFLVVVLVAAPLALVGNLAGQGATEVPRSTTELAVEIGLLAAGGAVYGVYHSTGYSDRWRSVRKYGPAGVFSVFVAVLAVLAVLAV